MVWLRMITFHTTPHAHTITRKPRDCKHINYVCVCGMCVAVCACAGCWAVKDQCYDI